MPRVVHLRVESTEFYLTFMDPTRYYSHAVFERDDKPLEAARDEIAGRWGEMLYRRRLNLWGSAQAFLSRSMDAYRVVLEYPGINAELANS